MNKDPLRNIKNDIEREVFKNTTPTSQKRAILTKIKREKQKKSSPKSTFINLGVSLCVIMILTILSSSYLFKDDLVKENDKEESIDQFTFIPNDNLDEQIKDEKALIRKSAKPVDRVKEKEETGEQEEQEEKVPTDEKEQESKPEKVDVPPLAPFDLSIILRQPDQFKQQAKNGTFIGTSFTIGDSIDEIQELYKDKYEDINIMKGHKDYDRINNYLLHFLQDEKKLLQIRSNISSVYKLDQVIETLGEPYYFYNVMEGVFTANYHYGEYIVEMQLDGLNKVKPHTAGEIQTVDRGSYITSVALLKNKGGADYLSKDIQYLGEEEVLNFREEWFNEARDHIVQNTVSHAVLLRSQQDPLEFNIVVPQETPEDEMRAIANQFLKRLTEVSNEAIEEGTIWNDYTYVIHIENSIDGYYDTGLSNSKSTHEGGYPDINWTGDLSSTE